MTDLATNLIENESDYRAWIAVQRVQNVRPPYSLAFQVTPLSKFGDPWWEYPPEWLPAGHRTRPLIDFSAKRVVPHGSKISLTVSKHSLLIQQLKEVLVAMIFLRTLLPGRNDAAKPLTVLNDGQRLCQLFTNFAAAGITSLSELTQKRLNSIFDALPVAPKAHFMLIGHFKDIVVMCNEGLITDPPALPHASIEMREIAEETAQNHRARTLDEEETSFLLGHSRTYIDFVAIIALQIKMYRKGAITATRLLEWAWVHLPVRKGLTAHNIDYQLDWLVKISIYNLVVFHLGSRASEALTLDGNSISATGRAHDLLHAQITLTIFKGSKKGEKRTYDVHPYLLKVNAAIHAMADAFDRSATGPVFLKKDESLEICVHNLNEKIRQFADRHGRKIDMSSHSWRFTLADIVLQAADTPFPAIQYQLGHEYISESIGYGLHGPSGCDLMKAGIEAAARSIDAFVDRCFDVAEIGGTQGQMITESIEGGAGRDEVKAQMKDFGLFPLTVDKDRFCVKQAHARGACATSTGDDLPEIEHGGPIASSRLNCRQTLPNGTHS